MSQLKKVEKARIHLLLDSPFYATLALELNLVEDNTIFPPTACTDGRTMWFHEKFIEKLSLEQVKTVVAHEILHIAYCHHLRIGTRDHNRWNRACDYSINSILLEDSTAPIYISSSPLSITVNSRLPSVIFIFRLPSTTFFPVSVTMKISPVDGE